VLSLPITPGISLLEVENVIDTLTESLS
jgi:hypothetical protein